MAKSAGRKNSKNRYYSGSKISEYRFLKLLRDFANDVSASEAAGNARLSVRSANEIYVRLRVQIYDELWRNPARFNNAGFELLGLLDPEQQLEYEGPDAGWQFRTENEGYQWLYSIEQRANETAYVLLLQRHKSRGISSTHWRFHKYEIYAREKSATLRRDPIYTIADAFDNVSDEDMQMGMEVMCRFFSRLPENDTYFRNQRAPSNDVFFNDLKSMLLENPL